MVTGLLLENSDNGPQNGLVSERNTGQEQKTKDERFDWKSSAVCNLRGDQTRTLNTVRDAPRKIRRWAPSTLRGQSVSMRYECVTCDQANTLRGMFSVLCLS